MMADDRPELSGQHKPHDASGAGPVEGRGMNAESVLAAYHAATFGVHLFHLHDDGELVFVGSNPMAATLLKLDLEPFQGKTIKAAFPAIADTELPQRLKEVAENGGSWSRGMIPLDTDRLKSAFSVTSFQPFPNHVLVVFHDINDQLTHRQDLESRREQLEMILDSARFGVWEFDLKQGIMQTDQRGMERLGLAPETSTLTYQQWLDLIHPAHRERIAESLRVHLAGETDSYDEEYQIRLGEGLFGWVAIRGKVIEWDSSGAPVKMTGMYEDITERRNQEQIAKARRERTYRFQSTLLYLMTHRSLHADNFSRAARTITSAVADLLKMERVSVWLLDDDKQSMTCIDLYQRSGEQHSSGQRLVVADNPNYFMALDAGRYIAATDARKDPRTRDFLKDYLEPLAIYSMLDAPIRIEGHVVGAICIEPVGAPHEWDDEEIGFVGQVADQAAQSLLNIKRRESERALRRSEERFRSFIDNVDDSIYFQRVDGSINHLTDSVSKTSGYSPADYADDPELWKKIIHPDDYDEAQRFFTEMAGKVDRFDVIYRLKHKDGSWRWIQSRMVAAKDERGDITGYHCVDRDITELKTAEEKVSRSEARFRNLFKKSQDGIYIRRGAHFLVVSPSFERLFGYSVDEMTSDDFDIHLLVAPGDRERVRSHLHAFDAGDTAEVEQSFTGITRDGTEIDIELRISWLEWEGKPAVMGILRDVTEKKKLENQLLHSQKMEAVGRLAGGIAHDFNNLLTAISGNSELALLHLKQDDPLYRFVRDIAKTTDRGAALTRQLLAFSRKQVAEPRLVDLNTVLVNMEYMLRRLIGEDVHFTLQRADRLGHLVADPVQLEQVIINLVVNARDAMPEGGRLLIRTEEVHLDQEYANSQVDASVGPHVRLAVSDTGLGIPDDVLPHIFEPFYTTKPESEGTGLGLATVYGIVHQNGGHITVETARENGSVFSIYLPCVPANEMKQKDLITTPNSELMGSETILVVEDDDSVRHTTTQILAQYGYHVISAPDAATAIHAANTATDISLDLVLTDIIMPDMNGPDLADYIQSQREDVKIIYMSGYTHNEIEKKGLSATQLKYIQKPFRPIELVKLIRSTLDNASQP